MIVRLKSLFSRRPETGTKTAPEPEPAIPLAPPGQEAAPLPQYAGAKPGILKRLLSWRKKEAETSASPVNAGAEPETVEAAPSVPALETYLVNEPYASITLEASNPPRYVVGEAALTRGEESLLKELKTRLYEVIDIPYTTPEETTGYLRKRVEDMLRDFRIRLEPERMGRIMYYILRDLTGYGKLDPIIRDKSIEDISADGPGINVYVYHRRFGSLETNVSFTRDELDALIYKLAQRSGRHISLARPLLDASLPTKDRLQLSIGDEVTTRGSTLTIRKFRETPFTPIDLINFGTISLEMCAYFWMAVENGFNILFAGGTASGKTSMLNALSMFIPVNSKIVSIEDTREVNLLHQNWIPGVTREGEGKRQIEMFDLLRSALRQRPEYLLVGEIRGREAYTLFQAMATGHFTLSTVHADSVEAVVRRLTKPPIDVPLMLLDSLNVVVLLGMVRIGENRARRCTGVAEIIDIDFENEMLRTNMVFSWRPDEFSFTGESRLFERIMRKLSMTEEQLSREFTRRMDILRILQERGVNDFHKIARVFFECNVNPQEAERKLKEGLI
ncbi:MAG: type II/IV secretion system ATPase subunit [Chloroflexi bacterium]|nr:type II/IV secretion system ATPase subunit [Chloroflexota bacterium]